MAKFHFSTPYYIEGCVAAHASAPSCFPDRQSAVDEERYEGSNSFSARVVIISLGKSSTTEPSTHTRLDAPAQPLRGNPE